MFADLLELEQSSAMAFDCNQARVVLAERCKALPVDVADPTICSFDMSNQ